MGSMVSVAVALSASRGHRPQVSAMPASMPPLPLARNNLSAKVIMYARGTRDACGAVLAAAQSQRYWAAVASPAATASSSQPLRWQWWASLAKPRTEASAGRCKQQLAVHVHQWYTG
mmetsp:Transcript_45509/g.87493  ORF Transcript_45509/g.87493 Transcript_45509/m.87493 type:complete len:117 (-) Transcript_45509:2318-2668(-)